MDSWERFEETQLPSQAQFYSLLNDKHITQGTIQTCKESVETFKQETLGDYHDLYLKTDVCLLAYSFKNSEPYT